MKSHFPVVPVVIAGILMVPSAQNVAFAQEQVVVPGNTPVQNGPATLGTQGTAGGSSVGSVTTSGTTTPETTASGADVTNGDVTTGDGGTATGQSALPLVKVPDVADAGLADARNREGENAPVLTLESAVLESLRNNPTPRQARANLDAALARIGIAAASGKPQGNLSAQAQERRAVGGGSTAGAATGGNGLFNGFGADNESLSLNVSLPIYSGGQVRNSRRSAEAAARSALATAQQTEQELAAQTILGYISVLQNDELLQVADSNLATSRERRRIAGVRFEAGAAARLEVLQADADLASAQQSRIQASNNLAQSKAALNIILARAPETPMRVERVTTLVLPTSARFPLAEQATAIASGATPPPSADLRAVADQNLPSLEATRQTILSNQYNVEAQRSQRKPNIGLSLVSLISNPVAATGRLLLTAGASLAQTLFSGGRISSQVAQAKAQLEQTRYNLQGQTLQVANAIEGSVLTLDSATKRLASADTAVIAAQEALRAAQLGYTAGASTALDVINAQNSLVQAQTNSVNARYAVAQAQVQLAAATAITNTGSATGSSGLGSSAGTGQASTFSASGSNQNAGVNAGNQFGSTNGTLNNGTNNNLNNGNFNNGNLNNGNFNNVGF